MFDGKFIATLFAIVVSVFAICNFNTNKITSNEGFLPQLTVRKESVMANSMADYNNGKFFSVPPNLQSSLTARFDPQLYGAYAKLNMPKTANRAVDHLDPLTLGNMVRENFTDKRCGAPSYHTGKLMDPNYASGNYNELVNKNSQYLEVSDMLPATTMAAAPTLGPDGEATLPFIFERFVFANMKDRRRNGADLIRGDLPIVPNNTGWFQVAGNPSSILQAGAMNVMGGLDNENASNMAQLLNNFSGLSTFGGVDMSTVKNVSTGNAMSTVQINGFS
jgi:hypothetical protein